MNKNVDLNFFIGNESKYKDENIEFKNSNSYLA